jgi:hypothetical protein
MDIPDILPTHPDASDEGRREWAAAIDDFVSRVVADDNLRDLALALLLKRALESGDVFDSETEWGDILNAFVKRSPQNDGLNKSADRLYSMFHGLA